MCVCVCVSVCHIFIFSFVDGFRCFFTHKNTSSLANKILRFTTANSISFQNPYKLTQDKACSNY